MLVILPIAAWGLLWRLFVRLGWERREAVITTSIVWGVLLVLITEGLSLLAGLLKAFETLILNNPFRSADHPLFHLKPLDLIPVIWVFIILYIYAVYHFSSGPPHTPENLPPRTRLEWVLIGLIAFIFFVTGITALVAPPNTWDSMTYHMTRVAFWAQNGTVAHYPTVNIRQLLFPPFAEYAILHTYVLSGGDQFANLVQWFSMIGSTVVVSLLARDLGAKREGQWLSALLCATLPMSILQASSTQNDYVVTFWLLCLTWHVLRVAQTRLTWRTAAEIGVCMGLALLTKATAYVFCVSLLGAIFGIVLWQWRWRAWQGLVLMGVCALFVTGLFYLRNLQTFGAVFGPSSAQGESFNAEISPRVVLSNLVRNGAMHVMIVPNRLDEALGFQAKAQTLVESFHNVLSISPDDPHTTFSGQEFVVPKWNTNEDYAGNPAHLLVFAVAVILFGLSYRSHRWPGFYLALLTAHLIVFSALLRWMTWISRFHLFPFALMMAFAAVFVSQRRWMMGLFLLLIIPLSVGPLFLNETRLWTGPKSIFTLPRVDQYFVAARQLGEEMQHTVAMVKAAECSQVGVGAGGDQWVYPMFAMFRAADWPVRLELISESRAYPLGDFAPCALITYATFPLEHYMDATEYVLQSRSPSLFRVYLLTPQ